MSIKAAGYVLNVPPQRRELLLEEAEHGGSYYRSAPHVAEPVPTFQHSRRAPLVVFASFEDGKVTHIADGKKGALAGTGLSRLNMQDLQPLARPIGFDGLHSGVPKRLQTHLKRVLTGGGILPPKTLGAFVDRIVELDASVGGQLARYSKRRREALRRFEPRAKENLARLRLAGRGEKIHEMVCRCGGRVPIREVCRARSTTATIRTDLGVSGTLGTCGASNASNETRRS